MFNVFFFTYIEMPFTGKEKTSYVLEYARSQSNKTVQHAFVRKFSKQSTTAKCRYGHGRKNSKRKVVCAREKELDDQKHQKRLLSMFIKKQK